MSLLSQANDVLACLSHPRVSRKRLQNFRDSRLHSLLRHAYDHSPFYRQRWDALGLSYSADLGQFPIVDRKELRSGNVITVPASDDRLVRHSTSGTTSQSFEILRTVAELDLMRLHLCRALWLQGWRWHDNLVRIWNAASRTRQDSPRKKLLDRLGIFRRTDVQWPQAPELVADSLRRLRPTVIRGSPTALTRVTAILEPEDFRRLRVNRLFVDGEFLSTPTRKYLERRWAARVLEMYGSTELFGMAWSCPDCGFLHTFDDSVVLEVIRSDGQPAAPGEFGEVVATALHAFAMPLIRYRTGDLAVQGPREAPCGRPFGSLLKILGRSADLITLPDRRTFHPSELETILGDMAWVREFQLHEDASDSFTLRIIPCGTIPPDDPGKIEQLLHRGMGPAVRAVVPWVTDLPLEPGGKLRLVVGKTQRA